MNRFATAAELKQAAVDWIKARTAVSVTIVGRTRALASDCVRAVPEKGLLGVRRIGFAAFAAALAEPEIRARGLRSAGLLSMEATAAAAIEDTAKAGLLTHFSEVATMPGFPRAVARTIHDLRMNAVDADAVEGEIGLLYRSYLAELAGAKLADIAEILRIAAEAVRQNSGLQKPVLLADPPSDFLLERALSEALIEQPGSARIALARADGAIDRDESCLGLARAQLFCRQPERPRKLDDSVEFFSAASEGLESVEIARRLTALAAAGAKFDECAILVRDRGSYETMLGESLERAGIPAFFSRGVVRPHPAGRALLALLRCADEDLSSVRFCEYLSIGQARRTGEVASTAEVAPLDEWLREEGAEVPAAPRAEESQPVPRRWERLIVDSGIVGRFEVWARRMDGFARELAARAEKADEEQRVWLEADLEQWSELKSFVMPLLSLLESRSRSANWGEWLEWLSLLTRTAVLEPEPVLAILAELAPMSGVGPVGLSEVIRVLQPRLTTAREPVLGGPFGKVFVGTVGEARGRGWKFLFLPGLGEGLFPKRVLEDPLLLDEARQRLSPMLALRRDLVEQERALLRAALASAGERLCISYARTNGSTGRAQVPSYYALEVIRAAHGGLPDLRELESEAAERAGGAAGMMWPAPRSAQRAIDVFEFDLARIGQAQRGELRDGGLRYLVGANAHLSRALRAEFRRAKPKIDFNDGMVVRPESLVKWRSALQSHHLNARDYSVSALERFSQCPYQFYLAGMLGLRPREEPVAATHLDPMTRGLLFHKVLDGFFKQVRQFGVAEDLALQVLNRIFDQTTSEETERMLPVNPVLWRNELEDIRLDLHGWLKNWLEERADWKPVESEIDFSEVDVLGLARVRGRIDLLEQSEAVSRVTDFKTGKTPAYLGPNSVAKTAGGRQLQPIVYALAASTGRRAEVKESRLFFSTQRGGYRQHLVKIDGGALKSIENVLTAMNKSVATGTLPADPRTPGSEFNVRHACDICDFAKVCGPNAKRRAETKDREPLDAVDRVRSQP